MCGQNGEQEEDRTRGRQFLPKIAVNAFWSNPELELDHFCCVTLLAQEAHFGPNGAELRGLRIVRGGGCL